MALPGKVTKRVASMLSMGETLSLSKLRHGASIGNPGGRALGRSSAAMGRLNGGAAARLSGARMGTSAPISFGRARRAAARPVTSGTLNAARMGLPPSPARAASRIGLGAGVAPMAPPLSRRSLNAARMGLPSSPVRRAGRATIAPQVKAARKIPYGRIGAGAAVVGSGAMMYRNNKKQGSSGQGLPPGSQTGIYGM